MSQEQNRNRGGRPRKFAEPSQPVTVTLPESTIARLESIDRDRARAIVKATDMATGIAGHPPPAVETVEVERGRGIILVRNSVSLRRIPWLRLVEVAPSRFLLGIPTGTVLESLEVALLDLLENLSASEESERPMLEQLRNLIRHHRKGSSISKAEMLIVHTRVR